MKYIKKSRNWLHSIRLYLGGCVDALRLDVEGIIQPKVEWGYTL